MQKTTSSVGASSVGEGHDSADSGRCIHELIAQNALAYPHAVAVVDANEVDEQVTYAELDQRANQLAAFLQRHEITNKTLVGVALPPSREAIVAILAILKCGGAYLPFDPSYPRDRLEFMLLDARPTAILTTSLIAPRLPTTAAKVVRIDAVHDEVQSANCSGRDCETTLDNLAYVIYTSGSTGTPKGVMLEHRGLRDMALSHVRQFGIHRESRVLQFAPLSFDASVSEIFMTLLAGATLYIPDRKRLNPDLELIDVMQKYGITSVLFPPSTLSVLPDADLPNLETLIVGGERCPADLVNRWARGRDFFNAYGPTEGTVTATVWKCDAQDAGDPPIGLPRDHADVLILDESFQPVADGDCGELYLAGTGLARGYLNRPDLTEQRFINVPCDGVSTRMYRTGDLGRRRADGAIEFVGRVDRQVKVRGFRVEMGEIESCLGSHNDVAQVAVNHSRTDVTHVQLTAYCVLKPGAQNDAAKLRGWLRDKLPEYMIPAHLSILDSLPCDINGKIDYEALTQIVVDPQDREQRVPPRSAIEEGLAEIWCRVLGLDEVGMHEHFIELGGDSLLSVRVTQLAKERGWSLTTSQVFENPTIAELATVIDS